MCVCVCEGERERDRVGGEKEKRRTYRDGYIEKQKEEELSTEVELNIIPIY